MNDSENKIVAILGPTNTGKTYMAIEKMLEFNSGIFGLPLRLLAREVYDKCVLKLGTEKVALITGEEKIIPSGAKYYICTVESMPKDKVVDFVAVDEIQMCGDAERGHIFTDRLLNFRGEALTMFLVTCIYYRLRNVFNDFLCLCHAMYEYLGNRTERNKQLEMASNSTRCYDSSCLFSCFCYLSNSLIPLPNEHHPYHYRCWTLHRIFGQTFFFTQKENNFMWWSRLWVPLAQSHIQNHHYNKPADKSKCCDVCVFILLRFGNHFFHNHKYHGSCSESQCVG